jgi:hypothetical protein
MVKYRKKPIVVDAKQFVVYNAQGDSNATEVVWWILKNNGQARGENPFIYIQTLEGEMRADSMDYIIQGVNGEFYPCKPDIFEKTYELCELTK